MRFDCGTRGKCARGTWGGTGTGAGASVPRRRLLRAGLSCAGLAAASATSSALAGCGANDDPNALNVFAWSSYIPDAVVAAFEEETGIHVNLATFSSNEDMLGKVRTENPGTYDLVQPTGYMVELLRHQDLLEEFDHGKLSNLHNIAPQYLDKDYDPGNRYSVPYLGSITAIAVNRAMVNIDVTSWRDLFDPAFKGKLVMPNDVHEIIAIAALALGLDVNTEDPEELQRISDELMRLKDNIKLYDSDSPQTALAAGDVAGGAVWTAPIALAMVENPDIQIVYPQEGCALSIDGWSIPKGARHVESAHAFVDYMLRPEVAKVVSELYPYVQPNQGTIALLPETFRANRAMNVPEQVIEEGLLFNNPSPEALKIYNKIWTDLKG